MSKIWSASFLVFLLPSHFLHAGDWKSEARAELARFGSSAGLSVRSLDGEELLQVNGEKLFVPASTAKLISSSCVLKELGIAHSLKTQFGYVGEFSGGVIKGDLVIRGAGDPSYVIEDLKQDIEILQKVFGVREIRGQLVFDASFLGVEKLSLNDDFSGDDGRSFAVELTPFPFNHNSFSIWVWSEGGVVKVQHYPREALNPKVSNRVKLVSGSAQSVSVQYKRDTETIELTGSIGKEASPRVIYRAVPDVYDSLARVFQRVWTESGGKWSPMDYRVSAKPISFNKIWTHESRPITRMYLDINKLSTNFGSELLSLVAAEVKYGGPASLAKSQQLLRDCLKAWNVSAQRAELENASGLSRKSKIAPSAFTEIMAKTRKEDFFPELLSSLSVLGQDGTTRSRLGEYSGRARLKTGSIKGVRSIAGFLDPQSSRAMAFSLIFNDAKFSDADLRAVEDKIIQIILRQKA
jgi:D-alanyl-D-alanine carboxypeptidase/D-alanyl-D-alanine-endopeptidase (penicillin-binding protein 4)